MRDDGMIMKDLSGRFEIPELRRKFQPKTLLGVVSVYRCNKSS